MSQDDLKSCLGVHCGSARGTNAIAESAMAKISCNTRRHSADGAYVQGVHPGHHCDRIRVATGAGATLLRIQQASARGHLADIALRVRGCKGEICQRHSATRLGRQR